MAENFDVNPSDGDLKEERHPSLYFADGDIVISATSKTKTYIQFYRVDRIFLARRSPVFKDMLSLGEGAVNEQYDGAPKVHFPDDAEDVAGLLAGLYNTATLPLTRFSPDTPILVQGIMRLAVKYDIESIRTMIIRHIEADWPHTLQDWERRQHDKAKSLLFDSSDSDSEHHAVLYDRFPEPASAIRFVMEFGCPAILPAAFYELAVAPDVDFSSGIRWGCLHTTDLLTLVAGKSALLAQWAQTVQSIENNDYCTCSYGSRTWEPEDGPDYGKATVKCIIDMLQATNADDPSAPRATDPLNYLRQFDGAKDKHFRCYCDNAKGISDTIKSEAQWIWDHLPEYFSLQGLESTTEP
ncbi:hypothetical protein BC835DRAFT_755422 [Cytidiella melzeri]|nr:hypothetical protein BC835DRAFT_755422 [Cytidiella melzeri]